jgi:hypothetical protein
MSLNNPMFEKKTSEPGQFHGKLLKASLQNPITAIFRHWVFQSLLYADPTERWFKLGLDIILFCVFFALFSFWLPVLQASLLAFLIAHTLNFLFNSQLSCELKHFGVVFGSHDEFVKYFDDFISRAKLEPSIQRLVLIGSIANEKWTPCSDLDARILRKPGVINGLRSCWFLMKERTRALLVLFPLDLYVLDRHTSFKKLGPDAVKIDLQDDLFEHRLNLME